MKKLITLLFFAAQLMAVVVSAQQMSDTRPSIAIIDFTSNDQTALRQKMPDYLEDQLVNSGLFTVLERSKLNVVNAEAMYGRSGLVDTDKAVALGKQIGARYIMTGKIVDVGRDTTSYNGYGVRTKTTVSRLEVRVKIIDVETAGIVESIMKDGSREQLETGSLRMDGQGALMELARDLARKIMREVAESAFVQAHQPQKVDRVQVTFITDPKGADLEIDGLYYGNASGTLEVAAGQHEVVISKPGYEAWKKTVVFRDGMTINPELPRKPKM